MTVDIGNNDPWIDLVKAGPPAKPGWFDIIHAGANSAPMLACFNGLYWAGKEFGDPYTFGDPAVEGDRYRPAREPSVTHHGTVEFITEAPPCQGFAPRMIPARPKQ